MSDKYILKGKTPVACPDLITWAKWFEENDRRVAVTVLGENMVSTVFLAMDHNFASNGEPLLFETMTFGPNHDELGCERTTTWDAAQLAHDAAVGKLTRASLSKYKINR